MPTRLRNFVFTINNFTQADLDALNALPDVRYLIAAKETGEACGTPHLQGYCELDKQTSFSVIAGLLSGRAHLEPRKGSAKQADNYCRKGQQCHAQWASLGAAGADFGKNVDIRIEKGELSSQGKRTDLDELAGMCREGKKLKEIAESNPAEFIRFSRGIQTLHQTLAKERDMQKPKTVKVFYGPTGTGKTYNAMTAYPDAHKQSLTMGGWWDGYDAHETVVIDEFRAQIPFGALLQLLDVYPLKLQVKGGYREFIADTVIITSPEHPVLWYKSLDINDGKIAQLKRRIDEIWFYPERGSPAINKTDEDWALAQADAAATPEAFEQFE